jgi:hypothetical protein
LEPGHGAQRHLLNNQVDQLPSYLLSLWQKGLGKF